MITEVSGESCLTMACTDAYALFKSHNVQPGKVCRFCPNFSVELNERRQNCALTRCPLDYDMVYVSQPRLATAILEAS